MEKKGVKEFRVQWRQEEHNGAYKKQMRKAQKVGGYKLRKETEVGGKKKDDGIFMSAGFYRRKTGKDEGIFPQGYVRALLSVSARHSLTSARAWMIPEQEEQKMHKSGSVCG